MRLTLTGVGVYVMPEVDGCDFVAIVRFPFIGNI